MKHKLIGFSEALTERRNKRFQSNKPQPWIVRKLTIGIVVALVGWAWYVYIGRFCVPLIRGDPSVSGALGRKGLGIAFLAVFCFLGLMFWWAYIKAITTSPGYAREHVKKSYPSTPSHRPLPPNSDQPYTTNWALDSGLGMSYESMPPPPPNVAPLAPPSMFNTWESNEQAQSMGAGTGGMGYPPTLSSQQRKDESSGFGYGSTRGSRSYENLTEKGHGFNGFQTTEHEDRIKNGGGENSTINGGSLKFHSASKRDSASTLLSNPKLSPLPPPSPSHHPRDSQSRSQSRRQSQGQVQGPDMNQSRPSHSGSTRRQSSKSTTHPSEPNTHSHSQHHSRNSHSSKTKPHSTTEKSNRDLEFGKELNLPDHALTRKAILAPENRYCARDEHVKPMRAHHCRLCGTCVLKYDHHCPWIGQCVGAFNHKFFLNFAQWSTLWTGWIFSTLIAQNVRMTNRGGDVDVQELVIIALSGFFTIFTFTLSLAHTTLILKNQTTVESLIAREQKEDDDAMLEHIIEDQRGRLGLKFRGMCCGGWVGMIRMKRRVRKIWQAEWGSVAKEGNIWWLGSARANWEQTMGRRAWTWFLPIGGPEGDGLEFPRNERFDKEGRLMKRERWPKELQ